MSDHLISQMDDFMDRAHLHEPLICPVCESEFCESKAYGVSYNDEVLFCSSACVESWEENQRDAFYGV